MNWKWRCKTCGQILDDSNAVLKHMVNEHKEVMFYADPVAMDTWEVPTKKPEPKMEKPKKEEPEEESEYEDLNV